MIAYVYHFPPSELWEMDASDLEFWTKRAEEVGSYHQQRGA